MFIVGKVPKMQVMKTKKKLKNKSNLWLSDDLTPYRASLAYNARKCVKEGHISQVGPSIRFSSKPQRSKTKVDHEVGRPSSSR